MSAQVSIHASAREATSAWRLRRSPRSFQSTPPHGRRRELINECLRDWTVSIHASAREATRQPDRLYAVGNSFNRRLRTGGDYAWFAGSVVERQFQSTPPHGRRQCVRIKSPVCPRVSIHASAREATILPSSSSWFGKWFQSTPPHGRRPRLRPSTRPRARFNPRLRTGGDCPEAWRSLPGWPVSIHASAREATIAGDFIQTALQVSIHASAREATP